MRRSVSILLLVGLVRLAAFGDVVAMTWNLRWFPSGIADLRAAPEKEARVERDAGRILADGYRDQCRKNPAAWIVLVQELRDAETSARLTAATGVADLKPVVTSAFADNAGVPLWQQLGILSTLPVLDAGTAIWSRADGVQIPRGFVYALLDGGADGPILCFCLHLKSNWLSTEGVYATQKNIYKREAAAAQILAVVRTMRPKTGGRDIRILVGGDFNTNEDDPTFVSESTLRSFYGAHFRSCFRDLKKAQCVTHPGRGVFPDATFDYILYRGFERIVSRRIYPGTDVSDHHLVAIRLR